MKNNRVAIILLFASVLALVPFRAAEAADAVVTGACDEAAFNTALATVQASSGGTITFNCGTAPFYIYFSAPKSISKDVVLDGGNLAVLSGNNATRLFVVNAASSLTLKNITVRNGNSNGGDGGAISSQGSLVIDNSHLLYNTTGSMAVSGGAIVSSGPLTITNSELAYNTAGNGGALYPRWGAAVTDISNSVFHDNQATNDSSSGWGGAMLAWDGAPVTISGSTFTSNSAVSVGGALYVYTNSALALSGGALSYNVAEKGGAIYVAGSADITDTVFNTNHAFVYGAGLYNDGVANLNRVTFSGNWVSSDGAGGGIYSAGTLDLINSALVGNQAMDGAGIETSGTTTLLNSTLANNTSKGDYAAGGGILSSAGTVSLNFTTLVDNDAVGVLSQAGTSIYLSSGTLTLKNSIIKSKAAACAGPVALTSNGFNIATDASCSLTQGSDKPWLGQIFRVEAAQASALARFSHFSHVRT
jgi:predicted outer membrane repeat protein